MPMRDGPRRIDGLRDIGLGNPAHKTDHSNQDPDGGDPPQDAPTWRERQVQPSTGTGVGVFVCVGIEVGMVIGVGDEGCHVSKARTSWRDDAYSSSGGITVMFIVERSFVHVGPALADEFHT